MYRITRERITFIKGNKDELPLVDSGKKTHAEPT
jgi:hypothetical protein